MPNVFSVATECKDYRCGSVRTPVNPWGPWCTDDDVLQSMGEVVLTTLHKFAEIDGVLNDRDNIIVMVDEAHCTQEGDLGRKRREALSNAFLFGLTGTPINRASRNRSHVISGSNQIESDR